MRLITLAKKLVPILILFVAFLTKTNVTFAGTDIPNFAPNPSFEEGTINPDNWTAISSTHCDDSLVETSANFSWTPNTFLSGAKSLSINNVLLTNTGNIPNIWMSDRMSLPPGKFEFSAYSKTSDNLSTDLVVCIYFSNTNIKPFEFRTSDMDNVSVNGWAKYSSQFQGGNENAPDVRIALGAKCKQAPPCSGSIWFDDVSLKKVGPVIAQKFLDLNRNGVQDSREFTINSWKMSVFEGDNCQGNPIKTGLTHGDGEILFSAPIGKISLLEETRTNLINITPLCQNVTLTESVIPIIKFANGPRPRPPSFPYFSQLDPVWANQEYDHANSLGPFFCGNTIAGCGCAITSSAMLLKYHGVAKSPSGLETTPDTLNSWLKNNKGYAFDALKWNSIASYSVEANKNFGSQKIRFAGTGNANDFQTLDSDISDNRPSILQEPGHFIVANAKQETTYSISDPAFANRKTLASYSNTYLSSRRFEKTNTDLSTIYISTPAPNEVLFTDSIGRRVGKDPQTGETFQEIPNSYYFLEPTLLNQEQAEPVLPPTNSGVNMLVIINPTQGTYSLHSSSGALDFSAYDRKGKIQVIESSLLDDGDFEINYSPEPGTGFEVFQKIKIDIKPQGQTDRKGLLPIVLLSDSNFNALETDISTIKFGTGQISPIGNGLSVSNGKNNKKDLLIFFMAQDASLNGNPTNCLTGKTTNGQLFKGCSP